MKVAVLGAGCGGQAIAGYLASQGNEVNLYNRSSNRINPLAKNNQIILQGSISSQGRINRATTDIGEAVDGSDLIMVATTATGHYDIAKAMAPHLKEGQSIVLNPGRTFGILEFANSLFEHGCNAEVAVAEANTLLYATRIIVPGMSYIHGVKKKVAVAAVPHSKTGDVVALLNEHFPQFYAADNFLATSLGNIGAVFHPTITLANKDKIKKGADFDFYREGVTREVAEHMERVDDERLRIASSFGVDVQSLKEWLCERYCLSEDNLYDALRNNPVYRDLAAPKTLNMRYLTEDIPTGLVPFSEVGRAIGVRTDNIDALIEEASRELGVDFRKEGRTIAKLGLDKGIIFKNIEMLLSIEKMKDYLRLREAA